LITPVPTPSSSAPFRWQEAMAASSIPLVVVVALGSLLVSSAQDISRADVESSLISELVGLVGRDGPGALETALQPIHDSMPKDVEGVMQPQAIREVLHRFFVQRHGWFVKGLAEPAVEEQSEGWVPSYLVGLLEQRLASRSAGPREIAAVAGAFEGLAQKEAEARLERVYGSLELPVAGKLALSDAALVVRAYLAAYTGSKSSDEVPEHAAELLRRVEKSLSDLAAKGGLDLATMKRVAVAMGEQYGHFHQRQCVTGSKPQCLEASSLYAVCCREEAPQAEAQGFLPALAASLCALALLAWRVRGRRPCNEAKAECETEGAAEGDLKKPLPVGPPQTKIPAGLVLLVIVVAGFAGGLLDATVLAGALFAGLILLTGTRVAPKRGCGAKAKES